MPTPSPDVICVNNLSAHILGAGPSAFGLDALPCPVEITLRIELDDSVVPNDADSMPGLGVNYSSVSKAVYAAVSGRSFPNPAAILSTAARVPLALEAVKAVDVRAVLPRALLNGTCAYERRFDRNGSTTGHKGQLNGRVEGLGVNTIIGLHPHERRDRQRLELDVQVSDVPEGWGHRAFADEAYKFLEASAFGTLESLADTFTRHILSLDSVPVSSRVDVTFRKPSALPFATPSISVSRSRADYARRGGVRDMSTAAITRGLAGGAASASSAAASSSAKAPSSSVPSSSMPAASSFGASIPGERIFIAIGSNIGDKIGHVRRAVRELESRGVKTIDTSRLYESDPMYVTDQEVFLNGVLEVRTSLAPLDLLRVLKEVESEIGRTKTFRNGPRVVDLDLIAYGSQVVSIGEAGVEGWLRVPHASVAEREFVLRPLADMDADLLLPGLGSVKDLLARVEPGGLVPILPFPAPAGALRLTRPATPAIMAIYNATPDSFSDGDARRLDVNHALADCEALMNLPVPPAIIDVGGMSTRPGSQPCTLDEELSRTVPLIKAIRAASTPLASVPISVDTYRAEVASAVVEAGASCINDVRGGTEPGMLEAMAAASVPVILMHSRGDSTSMLTKEAHDYDHYGGILPGLRAELGDMVRAALRAGVKRWDIVLDPGLGFAKNDPDQLTMLKHLDEICTGELEGYPLLVGASRKGLVGRITGRKEAKERDWGDAAINTVCTMSGVVDILRCHDARGAQESVAMAKAIRDAK